jgi:hypothetical protein
MRVGPVVALMVLSSCSQQDAARAPAAGGPSDAADAPVAIDASDDSALDHASHPDAEDGIDAPADATSPPGPVVYPPDRTHSPITPFVATRLAHILEKNPSSRRDLFIKIGDSITVSGSFLHCFAGSSVQLDAHTALQPTLDLYRNATIAGTSPFNRTSLAAEVGRTAAWAISADPSPIQQEIAATNASVAVVMYGTNDIGWYGDDHVRTLVWFHDNMLNLVDQVIAAGIVPILSTIPHRDDSASHDAWVPTFNATIRALAQGRQVPLVDFYRELEPLADHGLGSDHVHPNTYAAGACVLTPDGLGKGFNVRNLVTLEALDRVRRAAIDAQKPIDTDAPTMQGAGTSSSPLLVQGNPFTDMRSTEDATSDVLNKYMGCSSNADESGPEYVYRLDVTTPVRVRAIVLDRGDVDIDLHLLSGTVSESACVARNDTIIEADLTAGTWYFVLDTYVDGGVERAGEFTFVVLTCQPGDPACQ